ncbi:unnamed protein product [Rotaria sp. Silwood2]|nr:unnamed protein product [Rotaria sp. Silwood2]
MNLFPVDENAAIYGFIARIDDEREIVAPIKEKRAAQQEYIKALALGHGVYLLEQDEASNDMFIISVGTLKPNSQSQITISYVSKLDSLHTSKKPTIRFVVPTTISPRYSPSYKIIASPTETQAEYAESVPYTIEFMCQVETLDQHIVSISSPSHLIKIDCNNEEIFLVTLSEQDTARDIALLIRVTLQKNRLRQGVQWRKHKKMIIQLLSISAVCIIFNVPWVLVIFAHQYGLREDIAKVGLIYTGFLYYFVIFLFPFVCCLSISEVRSKVDEKLLFWQRARKVGPTALPMVRPRTDGKVEQG